LNDVIAAILILPSSCIKRTLQSKSRQSRTNRNASAGKRAYKLREAQGKIKNKKPTKLKSADTTVAVQPTVHTAPPDTSLSCCGIKARSPPALSFVCSALVRSHVAMPVQALSRAMVFAHRQRIRGCSARRTLWLLL
jgi:hypothetical protein